jgi:hypothetical protein
VPTAKRGFFPNLQLDVKGVAAARTGHQSAPGPRPGCRHPPELRPAVWHLARRLSADRVSAGSGHHLWLSRERIRPWRLSILHLLMEQLRDAGSCVERDDWILRIDGVWTLRVRLLQAGSYRGCYRWEVRPGRRSVDIVVGARMAEDGCDPDQCRVAGMAGPRSPRGAGDRVGGGAVANGGTLASNGVTRCKRACRAAKR